ncbi:MAG: HdeD family acid-resistance protein, partial [Methyloceanibacter sp.]
MAASATPAKGRTVMVKKDRRDSLSKVLADKWWAMGLRAIAAILFGLICLLNPTLAVEVFVILFAAFMLVDGVFAIISGIRAAQTDKHWGLFILQGVVSIAAA